MWVLMQDAGDIYLSKYAGWLERLLADGRSWLLGDEPCIADFSVAQSIWFIRRAPPIAAELGGFARLVAWYERVQALGHGTSASMSSAEALEVSAHAKAHAAVSVAKGQPFEAGTEVTVTPTDYAADPVAGRLVGLDDDEVVIVRQDPRAGSVQVHFPRIAFQVKAVQ